MSRARDWVGRSERVEAHFVSGGVRAVGTAEALFEGPVLAIRTDSGERVHWLAELVRPADGPERDPVGTVRQDADGQVWVRVEHDRAIPWWPISGVPEGKRYLRRDHAEMVDSVRLGAVPGTPAAAGGAS